jgi:D-alanyl-D-alanine carboxypeptidase
VSLLLAGCAAGPAGAGGAAGPDAAGPADAADPAPQEPPATTPRPVPGPAEEPADEPVAVPAPSIDLTAHSTSDPASPWVVVNKHTPLDPPDYEPDLTTVRGYLVRPDAAGDLTALLDAADADGVHLTLRSAYRGYPKQAAVYEGWVAQLGQAEADAVSARPGHSEHQTGIAVDVGSSTRSECDFKECFGGTVEGRWAADHAAELGFLVRYTPDNSAVTGYAPESWHLRWVGRELAAYMNATGVTTLEEVFDVPGGGYAD